MRTQEDINDGTEHERGHSSWMSSTCKDVLSRFSNIQKKRSSPSKQPISFKNSAQFTKAPFITYQLLTQLLTQTLSSNQPIKIPSIIPRSQNTLVTMCSNKNNNRRYALSYYVAEVDGVMVDRSRIADPVLRIAGMPEPINSSNPIIVDSTQHSVDVTATTQALPLNRPATYLPIPTFDATATIAARRSFLKNHFKANAEALKADRALHRQHNKQVRKLRSHKRTQQGVRLPAVARSDIEGLAAAKMLTAAQAPAQIHNQSSLENKCRQYGRNPIAHHLVKTNVYAHSTMMTVVDLRDDHERAYNGQTIRRGAIYEPETGLNATKVNLQIYVEMSGNRQRAIREFRRVARSCPNVQSLHVEVIGEDSIGPAREVKKALQQDLNDKLSGFASTVAIDFSVSRYDSEDA